MSRGMVGVVGSFVAVTTCACATILSEVHLARDPAVYHLHHKMNPEVGRALDSHTFRESSYA